MGATVESTVVYVGPTVESTVVYVGPTVESTVGALRAPTFRCWLRQL